jgi:hypothetical protein
MGITITPDRDGRFQEVEKRLQGNIIAVKLMDKPVRSVEIDMGVFDGDPNNLRQVDEVELPSLIPKQEKHAHSSSPPFCAGGNGARQRYYGNDGSNRPAW